MEIKMSVRKSRTQASLTIWLALSLFAALVITFALYVHSEKQVNRANNLRHESLLLADELRQSSDDLTRMVRSYVATGNPIYKQCYREIIAIGDGKLPRPSEYHASYWELVLINKRPPPSSNDRKISLLELMREAGFSELELRTLTDAKINSDELIANERRAMALIETAGVELEANRSRALSLLFGEEYDRAKAAIMEPINAFYRLMDMRTQGAVRQAENTATMMRLFLIGFGLSLIVVIWRLNQILQTTLGGSLNEVYRQITRLGKGDFSTPIEVGDNRRNSILGWLAETQQNLHKLRQDRLLAENAMEASDTRYRALFDYAQVGIIIFHGDPTNTFTDGNPCICKMLGYSLDEFLQLRPADVVIQTEIEHIAPAIETVTSNIVHSREWILRRKDGSSFYADVIGTATPDGTMLSIIVDISERKQAEETLRRSEENLSITLQSIGDAVIATDAAGFITRMNPTAERMTGWSLAEASGQPLNRVFHIINATTRELALNPAQLVMEQGQVVGLANHTVLIARDGNEYQISDSAAPIRDSKGEILGVVLVFSDVTEKYKVEEALREKEWLLSESQRIAHIGSWSFDIEENKLTWSEETYRIYGVSPDTFEPTRDSFLSLIHPDDLNVILESATAIETGQPRKDEFRIITPSGNIRFISGHAEFLPASHSSPARMVGTAQDITALRQADERFRNTFKLIPNPLTLQTKEGVMLDCSDAFCESTGYSRAEIIGRNTQDLNLWVVPEQRFAMREELLSRGQVDAFEFKLRRRDGEIRTIALSARYLTKDPEPILLAVAHDITARKQAEEAVRLSEMRLRTIIDTEPECVKVVGEEGDILEMNTAGLAMLEARSLEDVKAHTLINFIVPSYRSAFIDLHKQVMAGENATLAFEIIGLQGTRRWLETHATPLRDTHTGETTKLLGVTRDISERKQAELALQESALHTQAILDNMFDGVITIDTHGTIHSFNKAATVIFGYSHEEVVGGNVTMLMPQHFKNQHESYLRHHNETLDSEVSNTLREVEGQRKNGEVFPMSLSISKILRAGKVTFVGLVRDISQQRHDEEEIYRLAFYDPLTNLPNRRLLFDRLQQAMLTSSRTDQHAALMFLDLDYFKQLNDSLGHDLGDVLLQQVATRLQSCVREGDSVARMGGDEFVMLIEALSVYPNEAAGQAEMIAHKVLEALSHPYSLREHSYVITPSIGIVLFLHQIESMDELLKKADVAMYQAKNAGRNNARFFDPTMQAAVSVRIELEKSMRKALEQKEFILHYQLQVNRAGVPTGAEALVRWNHSEHGMISPAAFIPLAEETGMILPLGQWVLETACAQLVQWAKLPETADWTMAVNVSVSQFAHLDFVANVTKALQKTGANPHQLKLELTESMLAKDVDEVIIKMFEIKALGVTFSLDDFGTGYSSLSYLKRLPLDQLKIDQSFVRDLLTDTNDAAIAQTIVALGHSLSLKVIAEGVETLEQRNSLAQMGCDAYQGYYFARPVVVEDLPRVIRNIPA
jgi:diguanylate cyclase (GGDEF)-like protein/PAS domain S-box-containing protein